MSQSKLLTDLNYFWLESGEETKCDSIIEFQKNGTVKLDQQEQKGIWSLIDHDQVKVTLNDKDYVLKFDPAKEKWIGNDPNLTTQPIMKETTEPVGEKSWFCISYADFCCGDKTSEECQDFG